MQDLLLPFGIGFAVFLFGVKTMEIGLHEWAGAFLSGWIRRFTHTPLHGLVTGTAATVLLQSSDVVTIIAIGLVNAGVLPFRDTLGLVLGANIGAGLTTDMLALDLSAQAYPFLITGGALWILLLLFARAEFLPERRIRQLASLRHFSLTICGFASIFIGLEQMTSIIPNLQSRGLFIWFVEQSQHSLAWGLSIGALMTAVIQSSAATIAVTMGLADVQAIPIELGIAIVLGANIGTCSTALLASIGGTKAGRSAAWFHLLLNIGGGLLFFPLIRELAALAGVGAVSPYDQIAHAQTWFNVLSSLLALPLCYIGINTRRQPPAKRPP